MLGSSVGGGGSATRANGGPPVRCATTSASDDAPNTSTSRRAAASPADAEGSTSARAFRARANIAAGNAPAMERRLPSRPSSPMAMTPSRAAAGMTSCAVKMPRAIGRSKAAPSLRMSAGARLIVTLRAGSFQPLCNSADRTRTPPSLTALAPRPTR